MSGRSRGTVGKRNGKNKEREKKKKKKKEKKKKRKRHKRPRPLVSGAGEHIHTYIHTQIPEIYPPLIPGRPRVPGHIWVERLERLERERERESAVSLFPIRRAPRARIGDSVSPSSVQEQRPLWTTGSRTGLVSGWANDPHSASGCRTQSTTLHHPRIYSTSSRSRVGGNDRRRIHAPRCLPVRIYVSMYVCTLLTGTCVLLR